MIHTKLILSACMLAAAALGCVLPIAANTAAAACDLTPFLAKAYWLPASFNPQAVGANYHPR